MYLFNGLVCAYRCTRLKCFQSISEDEQEDILVRLHNLKSKDEQDIFIQSLIDVHDVQRRRPRKGDASRIVDKVFKYHVIVGNNKQEVCYKAFLSLLAVTDKRVKRLRKLSMLGQSPCDKRGKHPSANTLPPETILHMREHIESYPVRESHYCGKVHKYLDARLNAKLMHKMFLEKHPAVKCSYQTFHAFINANYSLSFGRPQIDACCMCEELKTKLRSPHINDKAKRCASAELIIHKRRAEKFYKKLQADTSMNNEPHILSLSIDFMQNIQLPVIPVQETFYLRQLTTNVFCIHNNKSHKATVYVYHEGLANKGCNEVCSFLYKFLQDIPSEITELHLFADNCAGQNKNHTLTRLLLYLTDTGRFTKIEQYFPVRGHSFLPCDRDFATIKRTLRKHDRLYSVHELTELIVTSSRTGKFEVCEVQAIDIRNFKDWWPLVYKRHVVSEETASRTVPRDQKIYFGISTMMHFSYISQLRGCIIASQFIDGIVKHTFRLSQAGCQTPHFPPEHAYPTENVPLKALKVRDIAKLLPYVPYEHQEFYQKILLWPTREHINPEEQDC